MRRPNKQLGSYTVVALCLCTLAWLWFFGGNERLGLSGENSDKSLSHSRSRASSDSTVKRQHPSTNQALRPAEIDVNARLRAFFEKYPELETDLCENYSILSKQLDEIFPLESDGDPEYLKQLFKLIEILEAPQTWDADAAYQLHSTNSEKVAKVIQLLSSNPEIVNIGNFRVELMRLTLTTSYGYHLRGGNIQRAKELYGTLTLFHNSTNKLNRLNQNDSTYISSELNLYNLNSYAQAPQFIASQKPWKQSPTPLSQILLNSIPLVLSEIYDDTSKNANGQYIVHSERVSEDPFSKIPLKLEAVDLELAENVIAEQCIYLLHLLKPADSASTSLNFSTINETMKKRFIEDTNIPLQLRQIAEQTNISHFLTPPARLNLDIDESQIRYIAVHIAYAQSQALEWSGELPTSHVTGKPIIWDKKNNALHLGASSNNGKVEYYGTVQIPSHSN